MIQITAHMRIVLATEPVDFRKGIDALAALCRRRLQNDPFSGALFVFVNRSRKALRILVYDGQGFWLCHKRLSKGCFAWNFSAANGSVYDLAVVQLQELLWNAAPLSVSQSFRPIANNRPIFQKTAGHGKHCLI